VIGRGRDLSERLDELVLKVKGGEAQRLDKYLGGSLNWTRTRMQELIRQGKIRVNGEPTKPSRKVRRGDEVTVELAREGILPPDYDDFDLSILYEDPWIVVVNKPPDLLVHPVGRHIYDTLINYLHFRYRGQKQEDGELIRPRLCHRIDKDTTGVVVVGKDPHVHNQVRHQFESRLVSKEYLAVVAGRFPRDEEIQIPIGEGHDLESSLRHETLRNAHTSVRVLERFEACSLLSCVPHTGRQNQIRIHLAAVGFPIVGDERFGGNEAPTGFPGRYILHSSAIRFLHPRLGSPVELSAPLPGDVLDLLEKLRG